MYSKMARWKKTYGIKNYLFTKIVDYTISKIQKMKLLTNGGKISL